MFQTLRRLRQYQRLVSGRAHEEFEAAPADRPALIQAAQQLHAAVYLAHGYIESHMIGPDARLTPDHDPYQDHADYFIVVRRADQGREVLATARQIHHLPEQGHASYPTLHRLKLYPRERARIESLDPEQCVEISALAKRSRVSSLATLILYRAMWHHSLRAGHALWIMAVDTRLYGRLKLLFGDTFTPIGPRAFYMGSEVIPVCLEVPSSLDTIQKEARGLNLIKRRLRRDLVKFFLQGAPVKS